MERAAQVSMRARAHTHKYTHKHTHIHSTFYFSGQKGSSLKRILYIPIQMCKFAFCTPSASSSSWKYLLQIVYHRGMNYYYDDCKDCYYHYRTRSFANWLKRKRNLPSMRAHAAPYMLCNGGSWCRSLSSCHRSSRSMNRSDNSNASSDSSRRGNVHTHTQMLTHTHIHTYMHTYTHKHSYTHTHMYIHTPRTYTHIHTCTDTHTHAHTYTHPYTLTKRPSEPLRRSS